MSTFIGVLLDVSGSMKSSIDGGVNKEGGTWVRSIFTLIDDLVKHDVSRDNRVFAVGFGSQGKELFDAIGTIKECPSEGNANSGPASDRTIETIFELLEANGARTIRRWAEKNIVSQAVSEYLAQFILNKLVSDNQFTKRFVTDLPLACRDLEGALPEFMQRENSIVGVVVGRIFKTAQSVTSVAATQFRQATVEDISTVVKKSLIVDVDNKSVYSIPDAANVIRGCVNDQELTADRAKELLRIVEPFIYGSTPLYTALTKASYLLSTSVITYSNHRRLLIVVSDGMPTDGGDVNRIISQLERENVTVATCYISSSSKVEPRKLHSSVARCWEDGAKFLFTLSSHIPTDLVTRAIFIKKRWSIDIKNNETRLFMHVNHPDNLKDVCDIARNAVCCQDALSDLLVSVSLDIYINQKNKGFEAQRQEGGTCYANASAAVLHLAMKRILGRDGGYPDFVDLRDNLINRYGKDGAYLLGVLRDICPLYRLHYKEVNINEAMKAIAAKRPVIVTFRLTDKDWETFGRFYKDHPTGILKKRDLDRSRQSLNARTFGHAVVLTSYNSECLHLMNSWGEEWADNGFFRVENAEVLGLEFIDIFWTLNDLSLREKNYYRTHGSEVADKLMKSLTSLQVADFICPSCKLKSKVTEYNGTVSRAKCPRCSHQFPTADGDGNILALNIYLTSLSR